jgi:hypothetical protein
MALGVFFFVLIVGIGLVAVRVLGLEGGWLALGLAPAAGLAVAVIFTTWAAVLPLPEPLALVVLVLVAGGGLASAARRLRGVTGAGVAGALLGASVLIPLVVLALAFAGLEVPLSRHDGATHVETVVALEHGARWAGWYPPGVHTLLAAVLSVAPGLDAAQAAAEAAFGLTLLAPLAVFGFGYVVTGRPGLAALGAIFLSLTVQFPYTLQLMSLWPMAAALVLAIGVWTVGGLYLRLPCVPVAVLAGVLLGAILLIHGTELYTVALGLIALLLASLRHVRWLALGRDLGIAAATAAGVALPYISILVGWVGSGGATGYAQGLANTAVSGEPNIADALITLAFGSLSGGFIFDLPIRAGLLGLAVWAAIRHRHHRLLVCLFGLFFGLALVFRYLTAPGVMTIFVVTYPWGEWFRLLMVAAVPASLLQASALDTLRSAVRLPRRAVAPVLAAAGLVLAGCTWGTSDALSRSAHVRPPYTADDAAAMAWLRAHVEPGEVVANNWTGDAGIWAPYKANVAILAPREGAPDGQVAALRDVILANVDHLDRAAQAVCAAHVRYVYSGAPAGSSVEDQSFPPLDQLRSSPLLEEVFASGEAVVFRVNLVCP